MTAYPLITNSLFQVIVIYSFPASTLNFPLPPRIGRGE